VLRLESDGSRNHGVIAIIVTDLRRSTHLLARMVRERISTYHNVSIVTLDVSQCHLFCECTLHPIIFDHNRSAEMPYLASQLGFAKGFGPRQHTYDR